MQSRDPGRHLGPLGDEAKGGTADLVQAVAEDVRVMVEARIGLGPVAQEDQVARAPRCLPGRRRRCRWRTFRGVALAIRLTYLRSWASSEIGR